MQVLLAIVIVLSNITCFILGAKIGQKIPKNEEIPTFNPVKTINNIANNIEQKKEQEKIRIIAENIDNYDGTGIGQQDIPRD